MLVAVASEVVVLGDASSSEALVLVEVSPEAVVLGDASSSDPDPVVLVPVVESGEVVASAVPESEEPVLVYVSSSDPSSDSSSDSSLHPCSSLFSSCLQ